ncbi:DUF998 domain-containing protein [Novosphingobium sp. G106]|uniref:DUF998 domain-containing protein n=1 Tax=Novosphingobium sp. G106 TaxID=2849500 RepID=UPI001C2D0714|nr:DUF998 domain-containing protein [Novosphingobium sp. G106]MBV1689936.1 DUF998 domain-containing protein [Novosphingobium sp. G106]
MTSRLRLPGALWLLAGLLYLTSEAIAASAFVGYSYANNYISDLGVPYALTDGTVSPLAWVMNFGGFILDALLYGAAAIAAMGLQRPHRRRATAFVVFALIHSVGSILVGTVHSGPREIAAGTHDIHVLGAAMAIIGGNAASITASRFDASAAYRRASLFLGLVGLASLVMLEANRITGTPILADGLFERGSVYAITAWEILTGLTLLFSKRD